MLVLRRITPFCSVSVVHFEQKNPKCKITLLFWKHTVRMVPWNKCSLQAESFNDNIEEVYYSANLQVKSLYIKRLCIKQNSFINTFQDHAFMFFLSYRAIIIKAKKPLWSDCFLFFQGFYLSSLTVMYCSMYETHFAYKFISKKF